MPTIDAFFEAARAALVLAPDLTYRQAEQYGDSPALADELAALIVAGKKTATASGFELYMHDHAPLPQAHDLNIVLDSHNQPQALLYTEDVFIQPFAAVDAEQARLEGEGDGSLAYWRQAHERFFTQAYADAGLQFDPASSMVVIERFRVVYPVQD